MDLEILKNLGFGKKSVHFDPKFRQLGGISA